MCSGCCSFPPAATSFILQEFSQYGNILKHVVSFTFSVFVIDLFAERDVNLWYKAAHQVIVYQLLWKL